MLGLPCISVFRCGWNYSVYSTSIFLSVCTLLPGIRSLLVSWLQDVLQFKWHLLLCLELS
uniref:Uncharacterized protein n=1 Tax=Arundo donax TaxID=35708 RepID=A0A0A8ZYS5_ARUDO